ncbi:hypothetical protein GCM10025794_32920 [Massilia kyonggiensis]
MAIAPYAQTQGRPGHLQGGGAVQQIPQSIWGGKKGGGKAARHWTLEMVVTGDTTYLGST